MNAIKFFHHSKWPYIVLAVLCLIYALFSFYMLVIQTKTPFKIKAEGIILSSAKKYYFTNYESLEDATDNAVLARYQKNSEWMPNYLGTLYYDQQEWELKLDEAILNPTINRNPFLPYSRSIKKSKGDDFIFYGSGEIVSEEELMTGLIFNYPVGSVGNREYLQIKEIANRKVLYFEDDGIGVSYSLPDSQAYISVIFNSQISSSNTKGNFIFKFNDISPDISGSYYISYRPQNFFNASIQVRDSSGNVLFSKSNASNITFAIENVLFSLKINQKYGFATIFYFLGYIVFISGFLFFFITRKPGEAFNNPIQSSLLKSRIIMNCLILLGSGLLIKTFGDYTDRIYDFTLLLVFPVLFNISYFLVPYWQRINKADRNSDRLAKVLILVWKKMNPSKLFKLVFIKKLFEGKKPGSVIYTFCIIFFFILIPLILVLTNVVHNERILGWIPALHFQKILIILAYFTFSSKLILIRTELITARVGKFLRSVIPKFFELFKKHFNLLTKHKLILLFSCLISIATSDFGSLLFVMIAVFMIEVTIRSVELKSVLKGAGVIFFALLLANQLGLLDSRKFYRLLYSFFPPDADNFAHFSQADRESISYIWFNLKNFIENPHMGLYQDLKIPAVSRSVAHSDYAFHWSLMLGGKPFLLLVMICLSFLLTHLMFIFRCTLIPMKIGKNKYLKLVKNKYAVIISFWLAITVLQFIYQVFSNNILPFSVLSGIPMPFISVGRGDYVFLTLLLVGLEVLFYTNSFKGDLSQEKIKAVPSNQIFNSSFKKVQYILLVIISLFGLKWVQYQFDEEVIKITPQVQSQGKKKLPYYKPNSFDLVTQKKLVSQAQEIANEYDLTNLPAKIKKRLKPLHYAYFNGKSMAKVTKFPFRLSQKRLSERISWTKHFRFDHQMVSGPHKPFGKVYAEKVLVNDHFESLFSNPFYAHLSLNNSLLNYDLSAELNRLLKTYSQHYLPDNVKSSILILNNKTNKYIATAQYPNSSGKFVYHQNYFIGSIKKPLLLDAALSIDSKRYKNFKSRGLTLATWIQYSNYGYAGDLLRDVVQNHFEEFDDYLTAEYNLPFYSALSPSYSDRPINQVLDISLLANGGYQKYPLSMVLQWYRKLTFKANGNGPNASLLKDILNLPLHLYGTAAVVGQKLQNLKIDITQFIAKTGTLAEDGRNISSSFVIANQRFTIGLMMIGNKLPSNRTGLTAKYLFTKKVLPLLIKYSIIGTNTDVSLTSTAY